MNYEEYGLQPLTNEEHSKYLNKYPNGNNFHFEDGYTPDKNEYFKWINSDKIWLSIITTSNPAQKKYHRFQNELTEPQYQGGFMPLCYAPEKYFLMKDINKFMSRVWEDAEHVDGFLNWDTGEFWDNDSPNSTVAEFKDI